MKYLIKLLTAAAFISLTNCQTPNNPQKPYSDIDTSMKTDTTLAYRKIINSDSANKKSIDSLLKKFVIRKDEFRDIEFFMPKKFSSKYWPNYTTIYTYINSNGTLFLVSNYYSEDWIFHEEVQVLIDGNSYTSSDVPTYDKNNATDNSDGSVWENVSHTGNDDITIIKAIADNYEKVIKVRFVGRQHYHDMTLSAADKGAIRDTWKLYQLKFGS